MFKTEAVIHSLSKTQPDCPYDDVKIVHGDINTPNDVVAEYKNASFTSPIMETYILKGDCKMNTIDLDEQKESMKVLEEFALAAYNAGVNDCLKGVGIGAGLAAVAIIGGTALYYQMEKMKIKRRLGKKIRDLKEES